MCIMLHSKQPLLLCPLTQQEEKNAAALALMQPCTRQMRHTPTTQSYTPAAKPKNRSNTAFTQTQTGGRVLLCYCRCLLLLRSPHTVIHFWSALHLVTAIDSWAAVLTVGSNGIDEGSKMLSFLEPPAPLVWARSGDCPRLEPLSTHPCRYCNCSMTAVAVVNRTLLQFTAPVLAAAGGLQASA